MTKQTVTGRLWASRHGTARYYAFSGSAIGLIQPGAPAWKSGSARAEVPPAPPRRDRPVAAALTALPRARDPGP